MLEQIYLHQRQYSLQLRKEPYETRREHLLTLQKLVENHQTEICRALELDFQKPQFETLMTEIYSVVHEIKFALKHLRTWMKPQRVSTPLMMLGTKSEIAYEPRGVCLLISPWNYPFYLTMAPLVSAVAAGNCVIIKPSEYSRHTSSLMGQLIEKYFSPEHIHFVQGGPETTQALLQFPFDHIFYTGSSRVGRLIMEAAAKHLTPVTLELGGKSPTIVDKSADLEVAAEKLAWAKCLNAGQTCVAPDYLFVHQDIQAKFSNLLQEKIKAALHLNSGELQSSPDYARMISRHHTDRLIGLVKEAVDAGAQIIFGGDSDSEKHFIGPTLITKIPPQANLMKEEIFGPILPIIPYKELSEVIHFINDRPKPLVLYMYSNSKLDIDQVLRETSSGGAVINDSIIHLANTHLPFGGVGESGMGRSHGIHGFRTFSNDKSILRQGALGRFMRITYPPYTPFKMKFIKKLIRWRI
ncbi:aldehyde dehydrogenase family protein [Bdellovibrio sp. HCB2-146]|uniref:aldehyde dehydrogenase family protein n=1 Tax=Bdellovibrio sp. HCB2-146 TaxID=3394362 RepID=UPI0039BD3675